MKKRRIEKKLYSFISLRVKSNFPITAKQISEIAYVIEEAVYLQKMSSITKKILKVIDEPINTVHVRLRSSLFDRYKIKAIVELTTKESVK